MTRLEARYRRVLRLLPAGYRQAWEDDMVDTFLMSARKVSVGEIWSVVALSVRLHIGGEGSPARSFVWGQAIRLTVLLTMLWQIALVASGIGLALIAYDQLSEYRGFGGLVAGAAVSLAAYVLLLVGHSRLAALLVVLAPVVQVVLFVAEPSVGDLSLAPSLLLRHQGMFLAVLQAIGILLAFRADAPRIRPRNWLLVLLPAAVILPALYALGGKSVQLEWFVPAVALMLALLVRWRTAGQLPWAIASLLVATVMVAVALFVYVPAAGSYLGTLLGVGVEAVVLAALAVPIVRRVRRSYRKLAVQ